MSSKVVILQGITASQMLAVTDVLGDPRQRTLLVTMADDLLTKWIEKQELYIAMKASIMVIYPPIKYFLGYSTQFPP